MRKSPRKVCAFCGQTGGGELGGLQNTRDRSILAHYNCLIFSPLVTTTTDSEDEPEFDIPSVLAEIKRGKSLKCSYCRHSGATIGCNVKRCHKTFHYECAEKDKGITNDERYIVYCSKHVNEANTDSSSPQEIESSTPDRPSTSKKKKLLNSSPQQFTTDSEGGPKVKITSALADLKRGKELKCSYCKRTGATIGCSRNTCHKKYHLSCVEKDEGVLATVGDDQHVAYCFKHAEKDSDASEETERPRTPDSPSTSYAIPEKTMRKFSMGNYSSPRAKKKAEEDTEWPGSSERPSTSSGTRSLGKRTRKSTPRIYSSPRAKKKNTEQDMESSGSSEQPSTSYGTRPLRTRNRNSDLGTYSSRLTKNKNRSAQEDESPSRSSSSSSTSEETPVRKKKKKSQPRKIFKQITKRTRTGDKLADQQTDTNDTSNEANLKTTMSASPVKPKARRGRPPSKKKRQEASSQKKRKTFASVDSEDIQQSDGDAEREEMDAQAREVEREEMAEQAAEEDREEMDEQAGVEEREEMDEQAIEEEREELDSQTSGEEIEVVDLQSSGDEREEVDAQSKGDKRKEMNAQARNADVESNKERTTHTLNDLCIPSTSQARFDMNEFDFTKLYESQCRIANSIESGVSEFRNFAQQFQTLFKQFLDICQSLNHGICSNLTNAHEQNTSEVHHRLDATPDPLPLSHVNSHIPASTHDSANDADTDIDTLSAENAATNDAENAATSDAENAPTSDAKNTPTNDAKRPSRNTRSSVSAKKKRR